MFAVRHSYLFRWWRLVRNAIGTKALCANLPAFDVEPMSGIVETVEPVHQPCRADPAIGMVAGAQPAAGHPCRRPQSKAPSSNRQAGRHELRGGRRRHHRPEDAAPGVSLGPVRRLLHPRRPHLRTPHQAHQERNLNPNSRHMETNDVAIPLSCSPFQAAGVNLLSLGKRAFQHDCIRAKQEARS